MRNTIETALGWWNTNLGWYGWFIVLMAIFVVTLMSSAGVSRAALLVISGGMASIAFWAIFGDGITDLWFHYLGDEEIVDSSVRQTEEVTNVTAERKEKPSEREG